MPTYVLSDLRQIQGYVFGSPRLFEMRGASALVDFFDRAAVPELVRLHDGQLVFSGGGNFLAFFEDGDDDGKQAAQRLEEHARNAFFELTGSDGIEVIRHTSGAAFPEVQPELRRLMTAAKHCPRVALPPASIPFLKRCESCGREGADEPWRLPGAARDDPQRQWLGPICARKRRMHARLQKAAQTERDPHHPVLGLEQPLEVPPVIPELRRAGLPADFHQLTDGGDLGLVVADGNGLGTWFDGLDLKRYEDFSKEVDDKLRTALASAVEAAFPGDQEPALQVLICGGDDLVAAMPAARALPFVKALMERFWVDHPLGTGEVAGLAVGVIFAKPSFPFRQAHELAMGLLYRAKARCRKPREESEPIVTTAVDLHRVTATEVPSLSHELDKIRRGPESAEWSYGAAGPYTLEELDALAQLAESLGQVSPSQRGRLREILSPRDDGPQTPLHPHWKVPERVVRELRTWLGRQDERPFEIPEQAPPPRLLTVETRTARDGRRATSRRFKLADALLLADLPAVELPPRSATEPNPVEV